MKFKRVTPKTLDRVYYFVDNKRVSADKFEEQILICKIKRMSYNSSSIFQTDKHYISTFYYN